MFLPKLAAVERLSQQENAALHALRRTLLTFAAGALAGRQFLGRSRMVRAAEKADVKIIGAVRRESIRLGLPICEMSWVLEGSTQSRHSIEEIGGKVYKTYRMYEKAVG